MREFFVKKFVLMFCMQAHAVFEILSLHDLLAVFRKLRLFNFPCRIMNSKDGDCLSLQSVKNSIIPFY